MGSKRTPKQVADKFRILERGFKTNINVCNEEIADRLTSDITMKHAVFVGRLPITDPQDHDIAIYPEYLNNGQRLVLRVVGSQLIYDEFGTGDEGQRDPHPRKSEYNLNDYNSGPYIREDKYGRHYWFYKNKITNGVPSGKFLFESMMNAQNYKADVIKKKTKEHWANWILKG